MINEYNLKRMKYDFMGYSFQKINDLSFHHLIIPYRDCQRLHVPSDGYTKDNGAILRQNTSHDYLHIIEAYDYDMFLAITSELIDENILGKLDLNNLRRIRDILIQFEKEHTGDKTKKGYSLIKEEYIKGRVLK